MSKPFPVSPSESYLHVSNHHFPVVERHVSASRVRPGDIVGTAGRPDYVVLDWPTLNPEDDSRTFPVVFTPDGGIGTRQFDHNDETIPVLGHVPGTPAHALS